MGENPQPNTTHKQNYKLVNLVLVDTLIIVYSDNILLKNKNICIYNI